MGHRHTLPEGQSLLSIAGISVCAHKVTEELSSTRFSWLVQHNSSCFTWHRH